jgi:hypothetical protein
MAHARLRRIMYLVADSPYEDPQTAHDFAAQRIGAALNVRLEVNQDWISRS